MENLKIAQPVPKLWYKTSEKVGQNFWPIRYGAGTLEQERRVASFQMIHLEKAITGWALKCAQMLDRFKEQNWSLVHHFKISSSQSIKSSLRKPHIAHLEG